MTKTFSNVLALLASIAITIGLMVAYTTPTFAFFESGDSTTVRSLNNATVTNNVTITAKTGHNDALGGTGYDGGIGGNASSRSNGSATGGDGGNGGRGGDGGTVTTGAATAVGTVYNEVNTSRTVVESCGCDEDEDEIIPIFRQGFGNGDEQTVVNHNRASVLNTLAVEAKTGDNDVSGGEGGSGDAGGNARVGQSWHGWWSWWNNSTSTANGGDGGNGGNGGIGGTVRTGESYADGLITNIINRNVIRMEAGDDEVAI